ncbi:MAG: hypothetical protein ACE5I1_29970 [bacterium]
MQKLEITLENDLHVGLQNAAEKASQSIDQLVQELLRKSLQQFTFEHTFSDDHLAEGYRAMADENSQTVNEFMALQIMALDGQNGDRHDLD